MVHNPGLVGVAELDESRPVQVEVIGKAPADTPHTPIWYVPAVMYQATTGVTLV